MVPLESQTVMAALGLKPIIQTKHMDSGLQKNIVSVAQVSLLTIFSTYSFFFARNIDSIGNPTLLGNHPHNFVAPIWIEFGLIGALMLTFFLYRFNRFITNTIKHSDAAIYIISIITTVVILFSCSWSIWQTDVVLSYIMFLVCLSFLITTGKSNKREFI
jgi:O-antigen ligase